MKGDSNLGQVMAASVLVGFGLGWLAEKKWPQISPWGIAAGVLLGAASGFWELFKINARMSGSDSDSKKPKP
jgi:F0F1-type ATP synthase assembly protein I